MPACIHRSNMGFDFGLNGLSACFPKRKNRWLFQIDSVSGVVGALPPIKFSRPQLDLREQQVAHLTQNIYFPIMTDWKPLHLTLYDLKSNENPVFDWVSLVYDPKPQGDKEWKPIINTSCAESTGGICFKRNCLLCLYDGCGNVVEKWVYENCWPQSVNWGELDMASSEIVTVDVTLRFDRAYPDVATTSAISS